MIEAAVLEINKEWAEEKKEEAADEESKASE